MKKIAAISMLLLLLVGCEKTKTKDFIKKEIVKDNVHAKGNTVLEKNNECNIFDENYTKEKASKELLNYTEKISAKLVATSNKNWKYKVVKDSIQIAEKITVQGKVEYNYSKIPIKRIWNVSLSENKITLYTKGKYIPENRFEYHSLKTSQKNIISILSKEKTLKLYKQLKKVSLINCFLKTL